eukprot:5864520-Alexandrium_andersonii.AAC.1
MSPPRDCSVGGKPTSVVSAAGAADFAVAVSAAAAVVGAAAVAAGGFGLCAESGTEHTPRKLR